MNDLQFMPHQEEVLNLTDDKNRCAYYLDMGLGKTFVGAEKMYLLNNTVNLIVCQKSKIDDWVDHMKTYYPEYMVMDLTKKSEGVNFRTLVETKDLYDQNIQIVGVINYDLVFRRKYIAHGGYIRPRLTDGQRYIDLVAEYGKVNSQVIEFGLNMLDISEYISADNVFTVLIPLGAEQQDADGNNTGRLTIASVNSGKDYISDVITLAPNTKLTFKGCGYEKNVAMISQKIGNSYKPLVVSRSSNLEEYVYSSENTINVVLSGTNIKYSGANLSLNVLDSVSKVGANIDKLDPSRNVNDYFSLSLFSKFGVIGDSYASGEVYNLEGKPLDNYSISWGQIMARKNGTQCVNFSEGGLTTRTWLKSTKGLSLLNSTEPLDAYYLALGINDFIALKEPYLGTIADIEKQADTFYGNYGKIINAIKSHAPKAKIIMFTTAFDYADSPKFNNAIIEIANYFKIPYVVQLSDPFFTSDFYLKNQHYGHPVAICYSGMANAFDRLICKCVADNQKYFMFMYTAD